MTERSPGARILVIDDDDLVRDTVRDMLESGGHEARAVADGVAGLDALAADPADLVVTDILMPNKDGVETIIALRRRFPGVKIIAMSGGGQARNLDFLELAAKVGASEVLVKPFTREALLAAVARVLGTPGREG